MIHTAVKTFVPSLFLRAYEHELAKETHINRALRLFGADSSYVEIGVRDGACIRQIHARRKYAIDPAPVAAENIESDGTRLFRMESDTFFAGHATQAFESRPVHVALVDGLHEFEQTLRDILNLERIMHPNGMIFVHDCNPPSRKHAEDSNGEWNGDVWKVGYYLRHYRQDLRFVTLDCDWGLGVISSLSNSAPPVIAENVARVAALDYDVLAADRRGVLNLKSPLSFIPFLLGRRIAA